MPMTRAKPSSQFDAIEGDLVESDSSQRWVFNHIPHLGPIREGDLNESLLPYRGGLSGFKYRIFPTDKLYEAQSDNWGRCKGVEVFKIIGPSGEVDCEMRLQGERIVGADEQSNLRGMTVHSDVVSKTGLNPNTGWPDDDPRFLDGLKKAGLLPESLKAAEEAYGTVATREDVIEAISEGPSEELKAALAEIQELKELLRAKPKKRTRRPKKTAAKRD